MKLTHFWSSPDGTIQVFVKFVGPSWSEFKRLRAWLDSLLSPWIGQGIEGALRHVESASQGKPVQSTTPPHDITTPTEKDPKDRPYPKDRPCDIFGYVPKVEVDEGLPHIRTLSGKPMYVVLADTVYSYLRKRLAKRLRQKGLEVLHSGDGFYVNIDDEKIPVTLSKDASEWLHRDSLHDLKRPLARVVHIPGSGYSTIVGDTTYRTHLDESVLIFVAESILPHLLTSEEKT